MPRTAFGRSRMHIAAPAAALSMVLGGCVIDEVREDDVGDAPGCEAARRWPHGYAQREDLMLELINDRRAAGGECDGATRNPVADVLPSPELRCAARIHATYVAESGRVTHAGRGDSTTLSRIDRAAYPGVPRHEMIAADFDDAVATLDAWLRSKDHCDAIFDAKIDEVGIGHAMTLRGDAAGWVLLTGEIR